MAINRRGGEISIEQVKEIKENEDMRPSAGEKVNQEKPSDTAEKT